MGIASLLLTFFIVAQASSHSLSYFLRVPDVREKTRPSLIENPRHASGLIACHYRKALSHGLQQSHWTCLFKRGMKQHRHTSKFLLQINKLNAPKKPDSLSQT